jgi:hypothetical protein
MSDPDDVLKLVLDFVKAVESACVELRQHIAQLKDVEPERKWNWNPQTIEWVEAEGSKGPFEKSEDFNNLEFKRMLKDLNEHNGKLSRNGFFYWVYQNGSTVGRKRRP